MVLSQGYRGNGTNVSKGKANLVLETIIGTCV